MASGADRPTGHGLQALVEQGDAARAAGRWDRALEAYLRAIEQAPRSATVRHHAAICLSALARFGDALAEAVAATELDPALWQAVLLRVRLLRRLGRADEAHAVLETSPAARIALVEQERVSLAQRELGDSAGAARIAARACRMRPTPDRDALADLRLSALVAELYDPGETRADALAERFRRYARRELGPHARARPPRRARTPARPVVARRWRVGVLSPQLCASPVYFFGIGAMRELAREVDLVFFHRGQREDWATQAFRAIATDWQDVAGLQSAALELRLRTHDLDVLLDMGGWMDRIGLSALAGHPARRLYKWVGGQALSTGLRSFDGFIGDRWQSPPRFQPLYVERLANLEAGYVTYSPPPYMPAPRDADGDPALGVIANPAKLSRAFLGFLSRQIRGWQRTGEVPRLRFVDARYLHAGTRQRVLEGLAIEGERDFVRFVAPQDHFSWLTEVSRLAAVIDSFPYSGGLTTMEALSLGVPCLTRAGSLFCERHAWAHCMAAGLPRASFELGRQRGVLPGAWRGAGARRSLVPDGSPRRDHAALARAMLALFDA